MSVATTEDVAERLGRPLNPDEELQISGYLEDAESEIRRWRGGDRLVDPAWRQQVIKVECVAAMRAARLPSQLSVVVPQDETVSYDSSPSVRNAVYLLRSERRSLGLRLNGSVSLSPKPWDPWNE